MKLADIGLVGLAVMGANLALNMSSHGFDVAVFNRTPSATDAFMEGAAKGNDKIHPYYELEDLIAGLAKPRKIFLMIKAGEPVDNMIAKLIPMLDKEDIIIDGGNSHYPDTIRRTKLCEENGLLYIGTGVSGGEEGALNGPSMMPGGSPAAWPYVKPIFQAIAAKADGNPCCDWVGEDGAGHFVKMVHNGIEYGDMQLICEVFQLMRDSLNIDYDRMGRIFAQWNTRKLDSYLVKITSEILAYKTEDGERTVEKILDCAGQKGTGKWTGIEALDEGVPLTLITEAVYARCLSSEKDERVAASKLYNIVPELFTGNEKELRTIVDDLENALYACKIISYAQGYALMRQAAIAHNWNLNYGGIALMWRGGCIIRSVFLGKIKEAFDRNPDLTNLLCDPYFAEEMKNALPSLKRILCRAIEAGIPMPAFSAALSYFQGYTTENLPANLLQAQRDYFGAHTYERTDAPRGEHFHTDWSGHGGKTVSGTYNA